MIPTPIRLVSLFLAPVLVAALAVGQVSRDAVSQQGMVVSSSPHASNIGAAILKAGGNAVDAAVATGMA